VAYFWQLIITLLVRFSNALVLLAVELSIGVGDQSTLGGHKSFARKICINNQQNARILHDSCPKNDQNARIFMIFARKIYKKFPTLTWCLPEKKPECIIARKIFSPNCRGHVPPPPAPRLLRLWNLIRTGSSNAFDWFDDRRVKLPFWKICVALMLKLQCSGEEVVESNEAWWIFMRYWHGQFRGVFSGSGDLSALIFYLKKIINVC